MPKAHCSLYTIAFKIKFITEAEAVENSSEITQDHGHSESVLQHWRRNQVATLSGKLKMSAKHAKMGYFTPKCPELDKQAMEGFSQ